MKYCSFFMIWSVWVAIASSFFVFSYAADPYYEMESHNLNTMNSYFVPLSPLPRNASGEVDLADYVHISRNTQDPDAVLSNADSASNAVHVIHYMSSYNGVWLQIFLFLVIAFVVSVLPRSGFSETFAMLYEGVYDFFDDLLGHAVRPSVKLFVVGLFFTILFANFLGWFGDVVRFFFPRWLRNMTAGTGELEFNIALAIVSSCMILGVQARTLGGWHKVLHEFVPITGKGLLPNKFGDILISLFMGMLDIVGFFARIISLSLRLFGNMSAGSILLNVAYLGLSAVTVTLVGLNIPIGIPLIIYIQGVLSVLIQAFVFTLIIAIGVKMVAE